MMRFQQALLVLLFAGALADNGAAPVSLEGEPQRILQHLARPLREEEDGAVFLALKSARGLQEQPVERPLESDEEAAKEELDHFIDGPIAKGSAAVFSLTAIVSYFSLSLATTACRPLVPFHAFTLLLPPLFAFM